MFMHSAQKKKRFFNHLFNQKNVWIKLTGKKEICSYSLKKIECCGASGKKWNYLSTFSAGAKMHNNKKRGKFYIKYVLSGQR